MTLHNSIISSLVDRRRLLLGLASASALAAAPASASAIAAPAENPELVRLGNELPEVSRRFLDAKEAERAACREAAKVWPEPPPEIVGNGPELARNIRGAAILQHDATIRIGTPGFFAERAAWAKGRLDRGLKTDRATMQRIFDQARRAEPLAAAYFAECEAIRQNLNYPALNARLDEARAALKSIVGCIMVEPDESMTGVMIKAEALAAWGAVDPFLRTFNVEGVDWAQKLAASILSHAGKAAAA